MPRSMSNSRSRSRSRSRGSNDEDMPGFRVHVSDLGMHPDKREIERAFGKFGPVSEVWLARNPPCFAFVKFKYDDDGHEAIRELDGTELCGNRIRVSQARPRTRGRRPRGFDPSLRCYSCGETGHFSRDCRFHDGRFRSRFVSRERYERFQRSRSPRDRRRRSRSRSRDRRRRDSKRSRSQDADKTKSSVSPA